jgi:methylated-DNA-[protein]-cysteine S-methyltransferase
MTKLTVADHTTKLGTVRMVVRDDALCALGFVERWAPLARALRRRFGADVPAPGAHTAATARVAGALDAYFAGMVDGLDALPVDPGGTPFQHAVWTALRGIPAGTTASYGGLARAIGHADAVRAVGAANGANPIWLVLPCHRVIGADGSLTGYAYGLERKRWLLTHEADAARSISPRTASVAPTPA